MEFLQKVLSMDSAWFDQIRWSIKSPAFFLLQEFGVLGLAKGGKMIHLLLTADYEIFGNGTGDVRCCLINPTEHLLNLCDKYGARLTLFFEVCEYWAFQRAEAEGKLDGLCRPSVEMEFQSKKALKRGHDVQLHIHPQWLGAAMEDGYWKLNFNWWRVPDVPHGIGTMDDLFSLRGLLWKGKETLEQMLRTVKKDYECLAFRAGACCVQPEEKVLQAMRDVGLQVDSSLYYGGYSDRQPTVYDFRDVLDGPFPFRVGTSFKDKVESGGVLEVPIFSVWRRSSPFRYLRRLMSGENRRTWRQVPPPGCEGGSLVPAPPRQSKPNRILKKKVGIFDFCNLPWNTMVALLEHALKISRRKCLEMPVVAIGHPKFLGDLSQIEAFFEVIQKQYSDCVRFSTLSEYTSRA